jgi:hypothetical protein
VNSFVFLEIISFVFVAAFDFAAAFTADLTTPPTA